jgi:hypothetical protein
MSRSVLIVDASRPTARARSRMRSLSGYGVAAMSRVREKALWRREVIRFQGVQRDQRRVLNELLALLDELAANTIDRQLAKSDIQLGLEYVLGLGPPTPPRRPPT